MFVLTTLCSLLCCGFVLVNCVGDIGPGSWHVKFVSKCEQVNHKFMFEVGKHKVNRTHDAFDAKITLTEDFTDNFGVKVDLNKHVDGGWKPFQVLSDNNVVNFVNKYAKENVRACLEIAGIDPPEFPIKKGEYEVIDYIFDYSELPQEAAYGEFSAMCYVLDGTIEIGCIEVTLEFIEDNDDED